MINQKFILIAGLPGSGKTNLGKKIVSDYDNAVYMDDMFPTEKVRELNENVKKYNTIIISSSNLCIESIRKQVENYLKKISPLAEIEWIFFENDYDQCWANIIRDGGGKEKMNALDINHKIYRIPLNTKTIKVIVSEFS